MAMLSGRWRPLDEGPRRVMAMAVKERPGACPKKVLRTTGRNLTLSLVHDASHTFGLEEIVDLTGMDRIRLQRSPRVLVAQGHDVTLVSEPPGLPGNLPLTRTLPPW
ncbi:MAG TPA: hypothetical protein VF711_02435 [Acidimicrobiales bacterium]